MAACSCSEATLPQYVCLRSSVVRAASDRSMCKILKVSVSTSDGKQQQRTCWNLRLHTCTPVAWNAIQGCLVQLLSQSGMSWSCPVSWESEKRT